MGMGIVTPCGANNLRQQQPPAPNMLNQTQWLEVRAGLSFRTLMLSGPHDRNTHLKVATSLTRLLSPWSGCWCLRRTSTTCHQKWWHLQPNGCWRKGPWTAGLPRSRFALLCLCLTSCSCLLLPCTIVLAFWRRWWWRRKSSEVSMRFSMEWTDWNIITCLAAAF